MIWSNKGGMMFDQLAKQMTNAAYPGMLAQLGQAQTVATEQTVFGSLENAAATLAAVEDQLAEFGRRMFNVPMNGTEKNLVDKPCQLSILERAINIQDRLFHVQKRLAEMLSRT
jgi:hypothetical protein